jgi:hypothetical protein
MIMPGAWPGPAAYRPTHSDSARSNPWFNHIRGCIRVHGVLRSCPGRVANGLSVVVSCFNLDSLIVRWPFFLQLVSRGPSRFAWSVASELGFLGIYDFEDSKTVALE